MRSEAGLLYKYYQRQKVHEHILIADPQTFARKHAKFIAAGAQRVQIISDFDRTLSSGASQTCHGCIEAADIFGPEYKAQTKAMLGNHTYAPGRRGLIHFFIYGCFLRRVLSPYRIVTQTDTRGEDRTHD